MQLSLSDRRSWERCLFSFPRTWPAPPPLRILAYSRTPDPRKPAYFAPHCSLHCDRACSPACARPRSTASRPSRCRSRSTSRSDCRPSRWWDCPTRASGKAATGSAARSAIRAIEFPPHRITVNLSPADVRKEGANFDLPIALGVLAAAGRVARRDVDDLLLIGALSLDGGIQPARGVLPVAAARAATATADCCCRSATSAKPPPSRACSCTA